MVAKKTDEAKILRLVLAMHQTLAHMVIVAYKEVPWLKVIFTLTK